MPDLLVPERVEELRHLAASGTFLSGGTDLLVQLRAGRLEDRLIDITNLTDAPPVAEWRDGGVDISALAPLRAVMEAVGNRLPGLVAAIRVFGSLQIRERATLGGNLANASPAADSVPPLVAAGATVIVEGPAARRDLAVEEFVRGPGRTDLQDGEWVSRVRIPLPRGEEGFRKVGGRQALAISVVSLAWRWSRGPEGELRDVRLALGAVAPTVRRCREAELALEGRSPTEAVVEPAVAAIRASISPIDDVRASAWYRAEVAGNLLREALGLRSH